MVGLESDFPLSKEEKARLKRKALRQQSEIPMISLASPHGAVALDTAFTWQANFQSPQWHIVLLSEQRRELAWSPPQVATIYRPEGQFREAMSKPGLYYWYAVGTKGGSQVRSDLTPIEVR